MESIDNHKSASKVEEVAQLRTELTELRKEFKELRTENTNLRTENKVRIYRYPHQVTLRQKSLINISFKTPLPPPM